MKPFWDEALKIINKYQFSVNGGPVILLQTENEYSAGIHHPDSDEYLNFLLKIVRDSGFKELIFNSDPDNTAQRYPIKGVYKDNSVLQTANLNRNALKHLTELKKNQPGKPAFVSEFWPGWFDDWHEQHHHRYSVETFEHEISDLLFKVKRTFLRNLKMKPDFYVTGQRLSELLHVLWWNKLCFSQRRKKG